MVLLVFPSGCACWGKLGGAGDLLTACLFFIGGIFALLLAFCPTHLSSPPVELLDNSGYSRGVPCCCS
eukprot:556219-Karenia_brevis.AAC.1